MIKYSKFTDNIGYGNFTDTFCQNIDKFTSTGGVTLPHTPSVGTPLSPNEVRLLELDAIGTTLGKTIK